MNQSHGFLVCWSSLDSEERIVNFYYKQNNVIEFLTQDDVHQHQGLLQQYYDHQYLLQRQLELQRDMEQFYQKRMWKQKKEIQMSFLIRQIVIVLVIVLQIVFLVRLIDKKLR